MFENIIKKTFYFVYDYISFSTRIQEFAVNCWNFAQFFITMDRNYVTKFQYKCSGLFIFRCYNTKDVYRVSLSEVFDLKNSVYLNNDIEMPLLGLGVYKITDQSEANTAVRAAVQAGYRLIDTATVYKNEEQIGTAIAKSGISRKEIFITTKVWNTAQRLGDTYGAFQRSLERLGTDYVDLYLIHWPVPGCYLDTWKEMEKIYESGQARAIGVSNFEIHHLEELKKVSDIVPAVNQIENHPLLYRKELIEYCKANHIQVQAYAPLARGAYLDNDIMCILGTKYAHTPAQVGLRWNIQKGVAVIPKSVHSDRIRSNANIFDFEIQDEDIAIMDTMNQNYHSSGIPDDLKDIPF